MSSANRATRVLPGQSILLLSDIAAGYALLRATGRLRARHCRASTLRDHCDGSDRLTQLFLAARWARLLVRFVMSCSPGAPGWPGYGRSQRVSKHGKFDRLRRGIMKDAKPPYRQWSRRASESNLAVSSVRLQRGEDRSNLPAIRLTGSSSIT